MLQFRHKRNETYHIRLVQNAHVQQRFQYHGPFAAIAGAVTQPTLNIMQLSHVGTAPRRNASSVSTSSLFDVFAYCSSVQAVRIFCERSYNRQLRFMTLSSSSLSLQSTSR